MGRVAGPCGSGRERPRREGVGNQDRVAFLDKNGLEHFEVFFGAAKLERRAASTSTGVSPRRRWRYIVNDAAGQGARRRPRLRAGARRHRRPSSRRSKQDRRHRRPRQARGLRRVGRRAPGRRPGVAEPARTTSPSSCTRRARPVAQGRDADQRQLLRAAADCTPDMWALGADSVNLVAMPLFHIGGGGWATGRHVRRRARASSCATSTRPRWSRLIPEQRHHPRVPRARRCCSSC